MKSFAIATISLALLILTYVLLVPSAALAGDVIIIGGTERQKRFVSCVSRATVNEFHALLNSDEPMTFVILDHQKFLQTRNSFHLFKTRLAFSNLAIRRVYLSSHVFTDSDTALRCVPHELGHFVTQSKFEGPAEFAAERIRWRTREVCEPAVQ